MKNKDFKHITQRDIIDLSDEEIERLARENPKLLSDMIKKGNNWARNLQNKSLKRMEEHPNEPLAPIYFEWKDKKTKGYIDWKDKSLFKNEYTGNFSKDAKQLKLIARYLSSKTIRENGYKAYKKDLVSRFSKGIRADSRIILGDKYLANVFWKIVNKAIEHTAFTQYRYSNDNKYDPSKVATTELQNIVMNEMINSGIENIYDSKYYVDTILSNIVSKLDENYVETISDDNDEFQANFVLGRNTGYEDNEQKDRTHKRKRRK